jgi:capsule polysaccharide export protein KpsC/LpsZ
MRDILTLTESVQNSRYVADCTEETLLTMNGNPMHKGFYNLIVSIRDVKLFIVGMKPHSNWKYKNVKEYFGLKGNKENVLNQLEQLKREYIGLSEL